MIRFARPALLFLLILAILPVPTRAKQAFPQRIVSLSPGVTEMLFALGLGSRVVGDTEACDYPPAAKKIAKVGDVTTNFERVVAMHPDLVVADRNANHSALSELEALKLPTLVIDTNSYTEVEQSIRMIGAATGSRAGAKQVIEKMEAQSDEAAAIAAKDSGKSPRVLVVIQTNPLWSAGAGSFLDDLITRAGGVNVAHAVKSYVPYSEENAIASEPDVVFVSSYDRTAFLIDPAMRALPAVRSGRVYTFPDDNIVMRPGPRLGDGLLFIAHMLHKGVTTP